MERSGVHSEDVELGYLAHPERGSHPGILLIPDVYGIYDHYRLLSQRLAGEGFTVLALNLYRRQGDPDLPDVEAVMDWIRNLSDPQVLEDIQAGINFLAAHESVGGGRVGITGFCMGGQYALLGACSCTGLSGCVPFYGMVAYEDGLDPQKKPRSPLDAIHQLSCPVLGLYGEEDHLIPVEDVRELENRLENNGKTWDVVLYPRAGHAFMNDTREAMYRPEQAKDAWGRMVRFFTQTLG